ncbi:MAG: PQQ-binding-like beta-propeller repeat protein [Melioribacteraceae bacterium]|nr:PQQ-binding-like beta-propeller repeat protein [Melioribacteraceae bacterium]
MIKFLFGILLLASIVCAQNIRFIIVDELDVTSKSGKDNLAKVINSINQLSEIDFVVFNGIKLDLDDTDDTIINSIKKIKFAVYALPSSSLFYPDNTAREEFMNLFGDLSFRKNYDSQKVIGLNTSVGWNNSPFFERETFSFLKNEKLDSLSSSIIILNSDPELIKNFDDLANHFNESKIKFIAAPLQSSKEFLRENISQLNTGVNTKRNEAFKIIEVGNDTIAVRIGKFEGELASEKIYTVKESSFIDANPDHLFDQSKMLIWKYDLGYSLSSRVITSSDRIYAADVSGQVVCLDSLGKKVWDYFSFGYIYSKPTLRDGYLAIATVQGDLETINARTGKPLQSLGFDSPITSDLMSFDYDGKYNLMMPKESRSKAAVVAGTKQGTLYCYDLETMQELWRFNQSTDAIIGEPLLIKNQIYFYSMDGHIYTVNSRTGLLAWKAKLTEKNETRVYASNIASNNESIFISLSNGKVFSYDVLLGRKNWESDKYRSSLTLNISKDGRHLFVRSTNDRFHVLSAKTGTWVRELITKVGDNYSFTEIIEHGKNIYYGNDDGFLIQMDTDYQTEKIFRQENSPLYSITPFGNNKLVIAYHNGIISLIRI